MPMPIPAPMGDVLPGHYVAFSGLAGSLRVKAIVDTADGNLLVIDGNNVGVWRSTNDGHNFDKIIDLEAAQDVGWAIRLSNDDILIGQLNGKIRLSEDNGLTWSLLSTLPAGGVREGAMIQSASGRVHVGANNGHHYYSDDLGATWTDNGVIGGATNIRELTELQNGRLLAGISLAAPGVMVLKSDDDGATWQNTTMPASNRTENIMVFMEAKDGSAVDAHGSSDTDLWRSVDHGDNWVVQENGGASGILIIAGYTNPVTGSMYTAGTSEASGGPVVRRSIDGGVSFVPAHTGATLARRVITGQNNARVFKRTPQYGAVLIGVEGTKPLWRSTDDGDTWTDPTS